MLCNCTTWKCTCPCMSADLVRIEVFAWRSDNLGHKGRVLDVFVIAKHMHGIFSRLCGPVANITGSITFVVTFNFGLRWTFHRKTWMGKKKHGHLRKKMQILPTQILQLCVFTLTSLWLTYPMYRRFLQQPPPQSQQIYQQHHPPALDPRPGPSAGRPLFQSSPQWD